jgi:hypothetical protein
MPRFVILHHQLPEDAGRASHWDLMFECGDALHTWALAREPEPGGAGEAAELAAHRLAYLDYEGPVSGGRGSVVRWDAGLYELNACGDGLWRAILEGNRMKTSVELARVGPEAHSWRVSFGAAPKRS